MPTEEIRVPRSWRGGVIAGALCVAVLALCAVAAFIALPDRLVPRTHGAPAAASWHSTATPTPPGHPPPTRPLIIGHHGAAGYLPANTLPSFELAIHQGVDYIEPDLVETKDGVLVARHENDLSPTTDVATHPEFASRRSTKHIEGKAVTGWFTEDFTLAELKTLHVPAPAGSLQSVTTAYTIPTVQEIIDLVRADDLTYHRSIGLCLETKQASYFNSIGKPIEPGLAAVLTRNHLDQPDAPVIVESFESGHLITLHKLIPVRLVQLIFVRSGPSDPAASPVALQAISRYAIGIAVERSWLSGLLSHKSATAPGSPTAPATPSAPIGAGLVQQAHQQHLVVYVYTLTNTQAEYRAYAHLGIDAVFTDNPDVARQALG